jgi:glucan phosphoethanolaminetransferase (alkaline phosphatase superfamily)
VTDSIPHLVVLVIGETARSANFSINGYGRDTNPRLSRQTNLVTYSRAYAQANLTSNSVPHILSRLDVSEKDKLYSEKSVTSAFKEAGFDFAWIGNQYEGIYTAVATRQVDFYYVSSKGLSAIDNFDINLLDEFSKALRTLDNPNKLVVMHTMGNHWQYNSRYPAEFDVFKPSLDRTFNLMKFTVEAKEKLVNSYDNCIRYTDYFLDSLISSIQALHEPALMLYVSDHGENLYDDEQGMVLHGSYKGSEYEYHVPFIIWYSDEYERLYPAKTAALHSHADKTFNSSVVFHTLLDAADVHEAVVPSKSLCSPDFEQTDTVSALTGDGHLIKITKDTIIR